MGNPVVLFLKRILVCKTNEDLGLGFRFALRRSCGPSSLPHRTHHSHAITAPRTGARYFPHLAPDLTVNAEIDTFNLHSGLPTRA